MGNDNVNLENNFQCITCTNTYMSFDLVHLLSLSPFSPTNQPWTYMKWTSNQRNWHCWNPQSVPTTRPKPPPGPAPHWSPSESTPRPLRYKHFVKSCSMRAGNGGVGSIREVTVVSGLPASNSTERLEMVDEERHVMSFSVVGGQHRLKNYRSVTSVNECRDDQGKVYTIVLESYVFDVPDGNTVEDTKMFVDMVVSLNLQKLAEVAMEDDN